MRLSPSAIQRYMTCPRQYDFHYVKRLRSRQVPVHLLLGRAVHDAIAGFHWSVYRFERYDIERAFIRYFDRELRQSQAKETPRWSVAEMRETGCMLVRNFPQAWEDTGLVPLIDKNGPIVERSLSMPIPGSSDELHGIVDILAMDPNGRVYELDYKTPASSSEASINLLSGESLPFASNSSQLTAYQALAQHNHNALGIEGIDKIGFMELVKRKVSGKKGPEIRPPQIVEPRSKDEIHDYMTTARFAAKNIRDGLFPKATGADFNSPCRLCDFAQACVTGDKSGLVNADALNEEQQSKAVLFDF